MTILCFDASLSNTGVSVFDDAGRCLSLLSINTNKEKTHPLKLKKIEKIIKKLKKDYKPEIIICEEAFTRFNKSTHAIFKVRGVIELVFWDIKQAFYPSTTIRKEVFGKGNCTKEEIHDFLVKKYNQNFEDFDQSDAFAVGICYFQREGVLKYND